MTSELLLDTFLPKWRAALRDRSTAERSYWEGQPAYTELQRTGYLDRVLLKEKGDEVRGKGLDHFIAARAVQRICAELRDYKRDLNRVRDLIERQKGQDEWLQKQSHAFHRKAFLVLQTDPALSKDLKKIVKKIDNAKRGTRIRLEGRWNFPVPGAVLAPVPGSDKVQQERQLDSRFQVRLASILRTYMQKDPSPRWKDERGPSLRTIARLIVLFLVCADMAEERQGEVKLKHNQRRITVDGVVQQLRDAGVDKRD
jgi:hypothetical protein